MLINKMFVLAISHAHLTHSIIIWLFVRNTHTLWVLTVSVFHMLRNISCTFNFTYSMAQSLSRHALLSLKRTLSKEPNLQKSSSSLKDVFFSFPHLHTSENPCFSTHWYYDRWETIKSPTQPCAEGSAETKITERQREMLYHSST